MTRNLNYSYGHINECTYLFKFQIILELEEGQLQLEKNVQRGS